MKTRSFRHGKHTYRAYCKPLGKKGYEVGFGFSSDTLFVGHFQTAKDANAWYTQMLKEVTTFSKKYWITPKASTSFYKKFLSSHLHKVYYAWMNKTLAKYSREQTRTFNQSMKRYNQLKKTWKTTDKVTLRRSA